MKRTLLLVCLLLIFLPAAGATAETNVLDEIAPYLLSLPPESAYLSAGAASDLAGRLTAAGVAVPEAFLGTDEPVAVYDFALAVCELAYGDYYDWPLEERNGFDLLMVEAGQLPYCFNLLPNADEISREEAFALAASAVKERYGLACDLEASDVSVSYVAVESGSAQGMWRFGIELPGGDSFAVHVRGGAVTACERIETLSGLEAEYTQLCEERGAFFTWPLQQKMDFANTLPAKLALARQRGETVLSEKDLLAISQYGFCLPGEGDIAQEAAYAAAADAVADAYGLPEGWDAAAERYYSFFVNEDAQRVWRVIFWKTGNDAYPSGVVDLYAGTGEVFRVEKNGTMPNEYIPYTDRM